MIDMNRWATVRGGDEDGPDNTDIESGDGGGSNPSQGCGDN